MAITDNSFTADELHAAFQANPALEAEIKTFGTKGGLSVRTATEEADFLKNYETSVISKKTSEFANNIEKDVLEVFGEPKLENEKYHDYLKRAVSSSKTALVALQQELADAKAASGGSAGEKARITQLETAIANEKKGYTDKLTEKDNEIHTLKASYAIERDLAPLRLKYQPGLPESVVKLVEQNLVAQLTREMKDIDGQFVVTGEDGNPVLDATTFKPKSIGQVLQERLADILDKGKQQQGAGTAGAAGAAADQTGVIKDTEGKVTAVASVPSSVTTKVALTDHLKQLGLTAGSKEFNEAFLKFGANLPLK